MEAFDRLVHIAARLRGDGGCAWDRAQTEQSLRPYLLEEAHEVLEAIDRGDDAELKKELGDLFFVSVLLSRIIEDRGAFVLEDALGAGADKMIRRHPQVFVPGGVDPEAPPDDAEAALARWEAKKASERDGQGSALDGVPRALPSLLRAHRVSEKAAAVGFDWPDVPGVRAKLSEEIAELDAAIASGSPEAIGEELGDVLFTLVNLGRHLPVGAEDALRIATTRFERRFRRLETTLRAEGQSLSTADADHVEATWRRVKPEDAC